MPPKSSAIGRALGDPQFQRGDTGLILSVVELGSKAPNEHKYIITHRHAWGMPTGASALGNPDSSFYDAHADDHSYPANSLADINIRATNPLPNGLQINPGQSVHVAEIFRKRRDILPLAGVQLPDSLYSAAYF